MSKEESSNVGKDKNKSILKQFFLSYVFNNAPVMPVHSLIWSSLPRILFSKDPKEVPRPCLCSDRIPTEQVR